MNDVFIPSSSSFSLSLTSYSSFSILPLPSFNLSVSYSSSPPSFYHDLSLPPFFPPFLNSKLLLPLPLASHHLFYAWFWPFSPVPPVCLLPLCSTSQHATLLARPAPAPPRPTAPPAPRWPPYRTATAGWAAKRGISSALSQESASVSQPVRVNVRVCVLVWWWSRAHLHKAFIKLLWVLVFIVLSGPSGNRTTNCSRVSAWLCPLGLARSHAKRRKVLCVSVAPINCIIHEKCQPSLWNTCF